MGYGIGKARCVLLMEKVSELQIMGNWVALHWRGFAACRSFSGVLEAGNGDR